MRSTFAKVIDSIAYLVAIFILTFAWVRFYTKNITLSAIIASIVSIASCIIINILLNKKERGVIKSSADKREAEALGLSLLGATNEEVLAYFLHSLSSDDYKLTNCKNYLIKEYHSAQNGVHSTMHSTLVLPYFIKSKFDVDDAIFALKLARTLGLTDIEIYAISSTSEAQDLLKKVKNINSTLFDQYKLFSIINHSYHIPKTLDTNTPKLNFAGMIAFAFDKQRARNYLLFGLILLATSFLVPYKLYYLITGSVLCLTATIVKILPLLKKEH